MSVAPARALELTLVVPCFDEAARLDVEAFRRFGRERTWLRVLFVDDGSRDGTRALLEALAGERGGRFAVLALGENHGKGEAVRRGILAALDASPDLVGYWDADLATPLEELDGFVAQFAAQPELEVLLGSRVRLLGRRIERRVLRHYLGRVAATCVSAILRLGVYDTQCGAKLFRADDALRQIFAEPFLTRWIFDVEVLARWVQRRRAGGASADAIERALQERPLQSWRDVAGSRMRARDFLVAPLDLWRIYRRYG